MVSGSGAIALAHLDGSGTAEAAAAMVSRVQQLAVGYPEGRLELQVIGGFTDPHRYSDELFANIMCECFNSIVIYYIVTSELSGECIHKNSFESIQQFSCSIDK